MDSPNISMRIRRHESLPCRVLHGHCSPKVPAQQNSIRAFRKTSVLIGRRLGATKNNPYVGSFRHSPPTSLRSMAASSLPSLSSMKNAASSSAVLSPSFAFAANSPYVGWFRHAPPVFSSSQYLDTSTISLKNKKNKTKRSTTKSPNKTSVVQHKVNQSLLELDRWHHQLTSLLMGVSDEETKKNPPLLLRQIINGRLLGGSGKDGTHVSSESGNSSDDNIIQRCNNMYRLNNRASALPFSRSSETIHQVVLSRLSSWLSFPLLFAEDDCYDEYGILRDGYGSNKTGRGLKFLLARPEGDRSIEIDSDETDDDSSSCSSLDYDPFRERSAPQGLSSEVEREFSTEANLSASEIAEAYYAQQLLDERRHRSNSDATNSSQQSGLSPSSLQDSAELNETGQRLDYEITQMDIARMARNASRHLDVDSILNLPTIVYQKRRKSSPWSPNRDRNKQTISQSDQSYLNVCAPIQEDRIDTLAQGGCIVIKGSEDEQSILSEEGWSFMLVSDIKSASKDALDKSASNKDDESGSEDEMCVICQEPFREGDRLRVLPCNHSFHVGCIDRWLSGTHSHNECFTAGCPTCKKRPTHDSSPMVSAHETPNVESGDDMSGSLPSWAFANLGSVMAMSSGDVLDGN